MLTIYILFGVVIAWMAVLTFLTLKMVTHYKRLTTRTKEGSIDHVLDTLLGHSDRHSKNIEALQQAVSGLDQARHSYFQKFGFVKFNPFGDKIAGEQSFVTAMLDNKGNGFVKTFLYTRDGVRVYVKPIKEGKAAEFELSQEEQEAVRRAA
ncbi:hypothetical protein A3I56_02955 [Candidatus Roizmanbacteria bacterium RIFCSPLOWO2_02_FULL_43_10]|uniref:DUF4446 domain-containing protein n=2 Tax=Candidatus Roizmaniibacteriota TaxID=1752723 RepID=A0A1F7JZV3_9BACT|nr:MAG: hypothetical protein A3D08_03750 [Candidatus Roizmanbacteria bacterium RIFCSPHIGHO2_02_FULL_43_11]OGK61135.1 MAG: hypothetical protein A3I56_02955 [Candidatus Roizmanbacteria bacterium RIFCSPLOWO2_02_FULL_43_10]